MTMKIGEIISNEILQDDYYKVEFYVPDICAKTQPGQFVHVKIANLRDRILRRPFSISDVYEDGRLTVVYKVVGEGTKVLATLEPGTVCDLMGPLGNPFSIPAEDEFPVIVAGGYGSAATYLLAERAPQKGVLLLGARSKNDLILVDKFQKAGFEVRTSTNDGSQGHKGFVTELIPQVLEEAKGKKIRFYGCGPTPMLMALAKILQDKGYDDGELSLDHLMCCGVGACFACVVKIKADNEDGWRYARTCKEGPVFKAAEVYTGE
jgi:dihydroorotate dehydrogenase electron transfer subunit